MYKKNKYSFHTDLNVHLITASLYYFNWTNKKTKA